MADLCLRPPRIDDELDVLAAHRELAADDFCFALGYEAGMRWHAYLELLEAERRGIDLLPNRVPATFLLAEDSRELVGRVSIRHALNDYLILVGGHIGFGVRPQHRRRGHATSILRLSLIVARSLGVDRALVTCDEDNVGSATVIERCGGVYESSHMLPGSVPVRRYWID